MTYDTRVKVQEDELAPLIEKVREATVRYNEACQVADDASRERTSRLNTLNEAQRAFDAALGKIRQQSPRDSDWKRDRGTLVRE